MRWLCGLTLITACNQAPLATAGTGHPPTGVYQVSHVVTANDCRPAPARFDGSEPVIVSDDHIFAPLPIGTLGLEGFRLPWDGLAVDLKFCGARRSFVLEIAHFDDHHLDLRRTTTWTETGAPTAPGCAPVADCSSIEDFHFSLVEACEHPCIVEGKLGAATCDCR